MASNTRIRIPRTIDRPANFFFVPGEYVLIWGGILVGCFLGASALNTVFPLPVFLWLVVGLALIFTHYTLYGREPWKYGGRFHKPPEWVRGYPTVQLSEPKLLSKMRKQRVGIAKQKREISPIERDFALVCPVQVNLRGVQAGGYLLQKGNQIRIVWSFDALGFNATGLDRVEQKIERLRDGLRDLPQREAYTVRVGTFSSDYARQAELQRLGEKTTSVPVKFLLRADRARTERLVKVGKFNPKYLHINAEFTQRGEHLEAKDGLERLIASGQKLWQRVTGERAATARLELETLLKTAFFEGYQQSWEFLRSKLGLQVQPRTVEDIHQFEWRRFNKTPPPENASQYLLLDREGLHWIERRERHPITALFASGTPIADKRWVFLPGIERYCGGVSYHTSPGGWKDERQQLLAGAKILNNPEVRDTEIVLQFVPTNQKLALKEAEGRTKTTNLDCKEANRKQAIAVRANKETAENAAIEALFHDGELEVRYGWLAIAYRANLEALDAALNHIRNQVLQPAVLEREEEYFDRLWVQAQPWCWERLLSTPFDRRKRLFTSHVPGMMPLTFDRTKDDEGICLIAKKGATPVYFNPFGEQPRHSAIIGTTGSGKSVMAAAPIVGALARNCDVTIIDSTRGDGSGTFDALTDFLGGVYYNTVTEANNLFETGNLQGISDPDERQAKETMYRKLLQSGLLMLVADKETPPHRQRTYRSLLNLGLDTFFQRPDMTARYKRAYAGGFGSSGWQEMPTLRDFEPHLTPVGLGLSAEEVTAEIETALGAMRVELRAVMSGPLGRAIARPSTFNTDNPLVVYALGGANEEADMGPLALSAYSHAIRRSFKQPRTFLFLDEASELIGNYESIAEIIGAVYSKGRKSGIAACYSGQDLHSVAKAKTAKQILDNTTGYWIGRVKSTAVRDLAAALEIDPELLRDNTADTFSLPRNWCATPWLMKVDSTICTGDYFPPIEQLALLVNEPEFVQKRREIFARYPDNPYQAVVETAKQLTYLF